MWVEFVCRCLMQFYHLKLAVMYIVLYMSICYIVLKW
jgi:hypothetical protein